MALVKLSYHEVRVGEPLDYAIYSSAGALLLNKGYVVQSQSQVDRLFNVGAFKDGPAASASSRGSAGSQARPSAADSKVFGGGFNPNQKLVGTGPLEPVSTEFPLLPAGPEVFQLTVGEAGAESSFRATYIGMVRGKTILVTVPHNGAALVVGALVNAKVFFGRNIYVFQTKVIARQAEPVALLHLEYPSTTRRHTLRRHVRVDVDIAARLFRNDAGMNGVDATVINLSQNGAAIRCTGVDLEVGEHFRLSLKVPAGERQHIAVLNAVARNVQSVDGGLQIGAEFTSVPDETKGYLQSHIFQVATGTEL